MVHNHGPDKGRGLDCPERRLEDGTLRGYCMDVHPLPTEEATAEGLEHIDNCPWCRRRFQQLPQAPTYNGQQDNSRGNQ